MTKNETGSVVHNGTAEQKAEFVDDNTFTNGHLPSSIM